MTHGSVQRSVQRSNLNTHHLRRRTTVIALAATASTLLVAGMLAFASPASAAVPTVGLGTAQAYSVLAGTTVTNTGPSTLNADLGVSPGSAITGFPPGIVEPGASTHAADAAAGQAQSDLTTAYNDAAGRTGGANVGSAIGVRTLLPGVYTASSALDLTGALTLNGNADPNAVFIFQVGSALTAATGGSVVLTNGARACNVFWQVGSSATLNPGSTFAGTIMALTSISVETGRTVVGRALARNGAVTLDTNTFTTSTCAFIAPSSPSASSTPTAVSSHVVSPPPGTVPKVLASTGVPFLKVLTPVSGLLLIVGGLLLAGSVRRRRPRTTPSA